MVMHSLILSFIHCNSAGVCCCAEIFSPQVHAVNGLKNIGEWRTLWDGGL